MELDLEKVISNLGDLGEIRAQLRELIHDKRDEAQRQIAVARTMAKLEDLPAKIDRMENRIDSRLEKVEGRLNTLETSESNRRTVNNVWLEILKSPVLGWLVGALGTGITIVLFFAKGGFGG